MVETSLENRVKRIVSDIFSVPLSELTAQSSPETIASWDSIGHLDLVLALEQEFGVRLEPNEVPQMGDVEKIGQILKRHLTVSDLKDEPAGRWLD
jgi:acyl carrier protein